jgi:type III restriction enzyme
VDFIIKFTSGTIGLFDTKSRSSDSEAANKHNGLIAYIEKQREEGKRITGGVIIPDTGNNSSEAQFRFSENRIENTDELTGWRYFNPSEL